MGELVLLVLAAAWAAVLIPPLLRSRIENRPNSSVTDFRRQLNRLQSTVPGRATGQMRQMARPLAQSPLHRPAAGGRPGAPAGTIRRQGTRSHGDRTPARGIAAPERDHRDRTGGQRRTHEMRDRTGGQRRPQQAHAARHAVPGAELQRRRRSNVLFLLVIAAGATLFLAATTKETALLYLFAISFLALCGYMWLLAQARQRETTSWPNDWMQAEREPRRAYR